MGTPRYRDDWQRSHQDHTFDWFHHRDRCSLHGAAGVQDRSAHFHHPLQGGLGGVRRPGQRPQKALAGRGEGHEAAESARASPLRHRAAEGRRLGPVPEYCVCVGGHRTGCGAAQCRLHVRPVCHSAVRQRREGCIGVVGRREDGSGRLVREREIGVRQLLICWISLSDQSLKAFVLMGE